MKIKIRLIAIIFFHFSLGATEPEFPTNNKHPILALFENTIAQVSNDSQSTCKNIDHLAIELRAQLQNKQAPFNLRDNLVVLNQIFSLKKLLLNTLSDQLVDCKKNHEKYFYLLYELERELTLQPNGIRQVQTKSWEKQYEFELGEFFNSKYYQGETKEFKHGDILITSNLIFRFDFGRSLTENDLITSHSAVVVIDQKTRKPMVLTIQNLNGFILTDLGTFLRSNNFMISILRSRNQTIAQKSADKLLEKFHQLSPHQKKHLFDDRFDLHDKSRLYCTEFIIDSINETDPNFLKPLNTSKIKLAANSVPSQYLQKNDVEIYFPKDFIFSGKFDLVGEWKFYPALRHNVLSYHISKAVSSLNHDQLSIERNFKSKVLHFLWPYRENEFVRRLFLKIGFTPDLLTQSKLDIILFGQKRILETRLCYKTLVDQDFSYYYKNNLNWRSNQESIEEAKNCVTSSFSKLKEGI